MLFDLKNKRVAYLGGYRDYTGGSWRYLGDNGFWWSSTVYDATYSWNHQLNSGEPRQYRNYSNRSNGFSVRCVRDLTGQYILVFTNEECNEISNEIVA